ncbi:MAG: chorismate synthase [Spirochaetaceae bacterium]|jgi:chorismate synthase|nr:chorismate synthase [Spirochaetaceae bacterium]
MAGNSFGNLFRITTFGESHGGGVGVILDGCPPGIEITEEEIQKELNRRKPGQSDLTTPRKESDKINILSGVFEGKTTGTPLMMVLYNKNVKSEDYNNIKDAFRPGHADWSYQKKYGIRDWRGSGRASGRETAGRVAAGAIAKKFLSQQGIQFTAYTLQAAGIRCKEYLPEEIENNPLRACDPKAAKEMEKLVIELKDKGDSTGGIVECRIEGVPPGLGEPVFDKIEADLAKGMLSLGAIRGFEIGDGFSVVDRRGSENNDWRDESGFLSNHAGGTLGGITTGQTILFRVAVKPTASISVPQKAVNIKGEALTIETHGRHDPIICPRMVPVVESMAALVIMDHLMRQKSIMR